MLAHILALAVLETEVDVAWGLECEVQGNYEGVFDVFQDIHFCYNEFRLFAQDYLLFRKCF